MRVGRYLIPLAVALALGSISAEKKAQYSAARPLQSAVSMYLDQTPYDQPLKDVRGNLVAPATPQERRNYREWENEIVEASKHSNAAHLLVVKADRRLDVYQRGKRTHSYPVETGTNCPDLRAKRGYERTPGVFDSCTPEGLYYIMLKWDNNELFHKALTLDYPNWSDFQQGRRDGRLSGWEDVDYVLSRMWNYFVRDKSRFDWSFATTGMGGIEGIIGARNFFGERGGTWFGAISMNDEDIDAIFPLVEERETRVAIVRHLR